MSCRFCTMANSNHSDSALSQRPSSGSFTQSWVYRAHTQVRSSSMGVEMITPSIPANRSRCTLGGRKSMANGVRLPRPLTSTPAVQIPSPLRLHLKLLDARPRPDRCCGG